VDLKALTLTQLARLYDALRSKVERTNSARDAFALVKVEAETDRRMMVRLS